MQTLDDAWNAQDEEVFRARHKRGRSRAFAGESADSLREPSRPRKRNIARRHHEHWYRTIDRVKHELLREAKLYFPDMKMRANPVLDRGETYPHHNLYYVTPRPPRRAPVARRSGGASGGPGAPRCHLGRPRKTRRASRIRLLASDSGWIERRGEDLNLRSACTDNGFRALRR